MAGMCQGLGVKRRRPSPAHGTARVRNEEMRLSGRLQGMYRGSPSVRPVPSHNQTLDVSYSLGINNIEVDIEHGAIAVYAWVNLVSVCMGQSGKCTRGSIW